MHANIKQENQFLCICPLNRNICFVFLSQINNLFGLWCDSTWTIFLLSWYPTDVSFKIPTRRFLYQKTATYLVVQCLNKRIYASTACGINYIAKYFSNATDIARWTTSSCSRPQPATDNDCRSNWLTVPHKGVVALVSEHTSVTYYIHKHFCKRMRTGSNLWLAASAEIHWQSAYIHTRLILNLNLDN